VTQADNNYGETTRRMTDLPNPSQYKRERAQERRYSGVDNYGKEAERKISNQTNHHLHQRVSAEQEHEYLRSNLTLYERRQSTPAGFKYKSSIYETLNKLTLSSLSNSSGDLEQPVGSAIKSGHKEIERIFSREEDSEELEEFCLNDLNCPNSSTVQCGCGLISCPCCNLLMNLQMTTSKY